MKTTTKDCVKLSEKLLFTVIESNGPFKCNSNGPLQWKSLGYFEGILQNKHIILPFLNCKLKFI